MKTAIIKKGFLLILPIYITVFYFLGLNTCVLKNVSGVPCPGCGMTRSAFSLISLNFKEVMLYHPLIYIVILLGIVLLFKNNQFIHRIYSNKLFWIMSLLIFIVFYIIRMIMYFPNTEPLDFDNGALIPRVIEMIKNTLKY